MKFNDLITDHKKSPKRVGRGIAAGQGKTAGRGTKGYGSRTGSKAKPGFAGGQNPIMQALPKLPGFRSHRPKMEYVYTGQLEALGIKTVDAQSLATAGLVSSAHIGVKLLAKGEMTKAVSVSLQGVSAKAAEAIEKAGGSVNIVPRIGRVANTDTSNRPAGSLRRAAKAAKMAAKPKVNK
jgi:large subunit ribosomal protein L15